MRSVFQTIRLPPDGVGRVIVSNDPSWRRVLIGAVTGSVFISAEFSPGLLTDAILAVGGETFVLSPDQLLYGAVPEGGPQTTVSVHVSHVVGDSMKHPHVEYAGL